MSHHQMPIGRPRSFDKDKALDQAMHVFWKEGFEGSSLNQLTNAMGINPASLYAAFGNKRQLFRQAMLRYRETQVPFVLEALQEPTAYGAAQRILNQMAVFLTRRGRPHGCLTIQTSLVGPLDSVDIQRDLKALRRAAESAMRERFERAKREGDLPSCVCAASLARFITAVYQGMTVQGVNGATRSDLLDLAKTAMAAWPRP